MESEREHEEGREEPLADRKLGELGNTDAKTVMPPDDEPSDDPAGRRRTSGLDRTRATLSVAPSSQTSAEGSVDWAHPGFRGRVARPGRLGTTATSSPGSTRV